MQQLLDIRFSFLCRTTHAGKDGKHPIIFRLTYRHERRDIFTGLYCNKQDWDGDAGRLFSNTGDNRATNKNLEKIQRKAGDDFDHLRYSGDNFSIDELIDKIKGKETAPTQLIEYLEEGNIAMLQRVGVDIKKPTYYKYRKSVQYMQEYLRTELNVKNYIINRVDTKFLEQYFRFLRTKKELSNNTACKYIVFVKTILGPAIREGVIKNDPFRMLRLRMEKTFPRYLTNEEIEILQKIILTDVDLNRKRDIFLFACLTGLAYIDLKKLSGKDIEGDADGTFFIRKCRQKTGEESVIPLLPPAIKILQKYSANNDPRQFSWYVSSNQKMNKGLKLIGKRAGLSKDLHMHMARHTFATTVTLSNGISIESVSKMLGHANIRQTQHYAKVVARKVKNEMSTLHALFGSY